MVTFLFRIATCAIAPRRLLATGRSGLGASRIASTAAVAVSVRCVILTIVLQCGQRTSRFSWSARSLNRFWQKPHCA
jgi:hypothetical protein